MTSRSRLLAGLAIGLVAIAVVAVVAGEPLVAGVCMLGTTFVIYLRETRS